MTKVNITTPVGRLVQGSLYKGNDKDAEGKPLVVKSGPNAGQPRKDYFFALAIPKGSEQHWSQTPWGQIIAQCGQQAFPQQWQTPSFAWKVKDGDSTIPNKRGKVPAQQEGYPGHWILSFSSGYPPKVLRDNGATLITEPDAVNLGDYVQVFGSVDGNGSSTQAGVFLNHSMVNLVGYGQRIIVGPDPTAVGFGQGVVMPAGASATPQGGTWAPQPAAAPPAMPMAAPPAMPVAVQPNHAFVQQAAAAPVMAPPAAPVMAPPAAPARRMLPAAQYTYEQYVAAGWNDQQLVQHGFMAA